MELIEEINKIIFVDEENTRLSPLAAALTAEKLKQAGLNGLKVCSRGNVVLFPEPANPACEELAERLGVSLFEHRAVQLEDSDFSSGTLTIAMDSLSKARIYEKYVSAVNAFTLKEILGENGDIFLPPGADEKQYENAGETLERLVNDLVEKLAQTGAGAARTEANIIAVGNDHAGYRMKLEIVQHLMKRGFEVKDTGCHSEESCDYPDFAKRVAKTVADGEAEKGILICGTGIGMSIAANKVPGIRAAVVTNEFMAQMTREHNDANVLCIGARVLDAETALKLVDIYLDTPFSGEEKHRRRISKLEGGAPAGE